MELLKINFLLLNSNLLPARKKVDYGQNTGNLIATVCGKVLIVCGYVTATVSAENHVLATINNVQIADYTQIILQVGSIPIEPYCMFGSLTTEGEITIGTSANGTIYRINCVAVTR